MQALNSLPRKTDEMWFSMPYFLQPSFLALVLLDIISYSSEFLELIPPHQKCSTG